MKSMRINKASDFTSISVLPTSSRLTYSRRRSVLSSSLPEMSSTFRNSQPQSQSQSQSRSHSRSQSQSQSQSQQQQRSQQSFSQGISSQQNAGFSQFSQNSQDEALTNDQSIISQERENSVKRFPGLPPVNHTREESQLAISRSSKGVIRKWGSGASEQRCQMSEEVEHRLGTIESSLSRFGLMLEAIQTDIMQVNRGTKEIAIDTIINRVNYKMSTSKDSTMRVNIGTKELARNVESIRQKLIAQDNYLQTIIKGQEDVKSTLNGQLKSIGELKSISDKLNQDTCHQNSKEISIMLSALQEKIRVFVLNSRNDLSKSFTNEMQALGCKLKALDQKNPTPTVLPPRAVNYGAKPVGIFPQKNSAPPPKVQSGTRIPKVERARIPKVEMGSWNLVKYEHTAIMDRDDINGHKHTRFPQTEPKRELRVSIDSDEDVDGGFAFFNENETGRYLAEKAKEETERILRKARRRKRKYSNAIVTIN